MLHGFRAGAGFCAGLLGAGFGAAGPGAGVFGAPTVRAFPVSGIKTLVSFGSGIFFPQRIEHPSRDAAPV